MWNASCSSTVSAGAAGGLREPLPAPYFKSKEVSTFPFALRSPSLVFSLPPHLLICRWGGGGHLVKLPEVLSVVYPIGEEPASVATASEWKGQIRFAAACIMLHLRGL